MLIDSARTERETWLRALASAVILPMSGSDVPLRPRETSYRKAML